MSGRPQFNIPAFDEAAATLRSAGYDIVSPAELDSPAMRAEALLSPDGKMNGKMAGETWGDVLARDVRLIADQVGGIIFLRWWPQSRGAKLEAFVGLLTKKQFGFYDEETKTVWVTDANAVRQQIIWEMP
jgi:hypothetical protein